MKIYCCLIVMGAAISACRVPQLSEPAARADMPKMFDNNNDTTNTVRVSWKQFFTDQQLVNLIDTALKNNQELAITLQEIEIARNEVRFRQAPLLPSVGAKVGAGLDKVGRYTSQGAGDASTQITTGKEIPDPLPDFAVSAYANWEIDIWKKLRNAKKAALTRYLASNEGRNWVLSGLIAEVASSYYELLALDSQLEIVRQNIALQQNAMEIVRVQKDAARVTELAVQKFQAEVLKSQSMEFDILRQITATENRINLLTGGYTGAIVRTGNSLLTINPASVATGIPAQMLNNRPDIRQAELDLQAARLDVRVARAEFYPSLGINAGIGFQAFNPKYLFRLPESVLYSVAGDLAGPIINRNAIKAEFGIANAKQLQALYNYERVVLNAYLEVSTELSNIGNLAKSYALRVRQVDALTRSTDIANDLFKSARADYLEVLMTQRDVLESKLELVETRRNQMIATTNIYRELGGGWQ